MKPRTTVYKGITMRSRLEAGFAAWLDECSFTWQYEPHAFAGARGQYLPDFRIDGLHWVGVGDVRAYLEVKPAGWWDKGSVEAWTSVLFESDRDALFVVVCPGSRPALFTADGPLGPGYWVLTDKGPPALGCAAPAPWFGEYWKAR